MIPNFKLNNGLQIPAQGLGTFTLKDEVMTNSIKAAYQAGCTLIDTASAYMNEHYVGASIKELERQGVLKREDLFITTKVGNGQQRHRNMEKEIDISLRNFKLEYIIYK